MSIKLGHSLDNISNLIDIINIFINKDDFEFIFNKFPQLIKLQNTLFNCNLYEFFNNGIPSYLETIFFNNNFEFKIFIPNSYSNTYPLFSIDESQFLFMNNSLYFENEKIFEINLNIWNHFKLEKKNNKIYILYNNDLKSFKLKNPSKVLINFGNLAFPCDLTFYLSFPKYNLLNDSNLTSIDLNRKIHGLINFYSYNPISNFLKDYILIFNHFQKIIDFNERILYFNLIKKIYLINNINQKLFLEDLFYLIKKTNKIIRFEWLEYWINNVFLLSNIDDRTLLFVTLFEDLEFWDIFVLPILNKLLDKILELINSQITLEYLIIEKTNLLFFIFYLIQLTYSKDLSPKFFKLLFILTNKVNLIHRTKFIDFLVRSKTSYFHLSINLNDLPIKKLILSYKDQNSLYNEIIDYFLLNDNQEISIFTPDQLLDISIFIYPSIGFTSLKKFLSLNYSFEYFQSKLSLLQLICPKYSNFESLWNLFFTKLIGEDFDISNEIRKNHKILRPYLIPLILSMSLTILNSDDFTLKNQVFKSLITVFKSSLSIIFSQYHNYFFSFLKFDMSNYPNIQINKIENIKVNKYLIDQKEIIESQIKNSFDEWYLQFKQNNNLNQIHENNEIITFFSSFLLELTLYNLSDPTLVLTLFKSIASFCNDDLIHNYLIILLGALSSSFISEEILKGIKKLLLTLSIKNKNIFTEPIILDLIIRLCEDNNNRIELFLDFFIFIIPILSNDVLNRVLNLFNLLSISILTKNLDTLYSLFYQLMFTELIYYHSFFPNLFNLVKKYSSIDIGNSIQDSNLFLRIGSFNEFFQNFEKKQQLKIQLFEITESYNKEKENFIIEFYKLLYNNSLIIFNRFFKFIFKLNLFLKKNEIKSFKFLIDFNLSNLKNRLNPFSLSPYGSFNYNTFDLIKSELFLYQKKIFSFNNDEQFNLYKNFLNLPLDYSFSYKSSIFNFNLFKTLYGNNFEFYECNLIRYEFNIPSVIAINNEMIYILTYFTFKNQKLEFLSNISNDFLESIFLNEFGNYNLFSLRPILRINKKDIYSIFKLNLLMIQLCTFKSGNFVLSFNNNLYLNNFNINQINFNSNDSNFEILLKLNLLLGKSFYLLNNYPIFPNINNENFEIIIKEYNCLFFKIKSIEYLPEHFYFPNFIEDINYKIILNNLIKLENFNLNNWINKFFHLNILF